MRFIIFTLFALQFLSSCNSDDAVFPVTVKVVHNQNNATSLNTDFNFHSDSFLEVVLYDNKLNENDSVIYNSRIDSIHSFPLEFTLDPDLPDKESGEYIIKVKVFSKKRNVLFTGDLASQIPYALNRNTGFIEIEVLGLEHCGEEFADSFCVNRDVKVESCPSVAGKNFIGPPIPPPCFGGEGCGYTGSVSFSKENNSASLHPVNSDAIAMMSYSQENSKIQVYSDGNQSNPVEFVHLNKCKEIMNQQSGNVYRDFQYPWNNTIY